MSTNSRDCGFLCRAVGAGKNWPIVGAVFDALPEACPPGYWTRMGINLNPFTWWNGATIGTWFGLRGKAVVGEDSLGNVYYQGGSDTNGNPRRWVIYNGANDASRVAPEWFSWLHHQVDDLPDRSLPAARVWQQPAVPNLTGTALAYRPSGALEKGGKRAAATGDYEAWTPDA